MRVSQQKAMQTMVLSGMLLTMIVSLLIRGGEGLRFGLTLLWLLPPVLLLLRRRERVKSGVSGIPSTGDGSVPDVHFSDVAANEEALESMRDLVSFIQSPEKYSRFGARIPRGVLLYGAPGTGKTLLARALAGEAGVPFFAVNGADFVEMYVGVGASRVRALFQKARKAGKAVIFFDEIDAVGRQRGAGLGGGHDEREQTLNQLLTEMDGFDGKKGVVILAATNRPESLDPALLRPGRFDRRIPAELPDMAGRKAILAVHAKKVKTEPDIDFDAVARATAGASGAELANIVNEAALRAVRSGRNTVTQADLEESVEVVIAGYQRKNAVISPTERKIIACHEIGHALVAAIQKDSAPVHKITIIPRTSGALGYTMQIDEGEKFLMTKEEALARITVLTGGRAAEELVFGTCTSGASNDIEKATQIARAMVTRFGMSEKFGMTALEITNDRYLSGNSSLICSPDTAYEIDIETRNIISQCYKNAADILRQNMDKLRRLTDCLLEKETLSGIEFMSIIAEK